MATRTVITGGGGDYTTLAAWEAARQADLTAGGGTGPEIAECSGGADTAVVDINGWTTNAANYIQIKAASGAEHGGVWNTGTYYLECAAGASAYTLSVNENFVRVEGLQIRQTQTTQRGALTVVTVNAGGDVRITECLLRTSSTNATATRGSVALVSAGNGTITFRNCAIYDSPVEAGVYVSGAATVNLDNCTLAGHGTYGIVRTAGTVTARNCYADGATDAYSGTMTLTTCAHSSATSFTGSTGSVAHTTSNFTNVTAGSEDYHLVSGASATLLTGGTDLSGTFTTDFEGDTRSDWSIGADEYVAAGGNVDGAGSSTLTFAASGVGSSLADAAASSTLTFAASGVGSSLADSAASSTLTFTSAGVGSSLADSAGSSSLTFTASGVGSSLFTAAGSATLTFAASGVGASFADSAGSAALTFTVSGASGDSDFADGAGTSSLTFSATAFGSSLFDAAGVSSITFTAAGVSVVEVVDQSPSRWRPHRRLGRGALNLN